jgi:hypothetical protein
VVQTDSLASAWTSRASQASASTFPCWYAAVCSVVSHSGEATGIPSRATALDWPHSATQGPRYLVSKQQQRQRYQANSPGLSRYEVEEDEAWHEAHRENYVEIEEGGVISKGRNGGNQEGGGLARARRSDGPGSRFPGRGAHSVSVRL